MGRGVSTVEQWLKSRGHTVKGFAQNRRIIEWEKAPDRCQSVRIKKRCIEEIHKHSVFCLFVCFFWERLSKRNQNINTFPITIFQWVAYPRRVVSTRPTHLDSSWPTHADDLLLRSHITQYRCGFCKVEYLYIGYSEGTTEYPQR